MSESKSGEKSHFWLFFILISALVTPPIMWLIALSSVAPEDRGSFVAETFKRPLTYVWLLYFAIAVFVIIKTYGQ